MSQGKKREEKIYKLWQAAFIIVRGREGYSHSMPCHATPEADLQRGKKLNHSTEHQHIHCTHTHLPNPSLRHCASRPCSCMKCCWRPWGADSGGLAVPACCASLEPASLPAEVLVLLLLLMRSAVLASKSTSRTWATWSLFHGWNSAVAGGMGAGAEAPTPLCRASMPLTSCVAGAGASTGAAWELNRWPGSRSLVCLTRLFSLPAACPARPTASSSASSELRRFLFCTGCSTRGPCVLLDCCAQHSCSCV